MGAGHQKLWGLGPSASFPYLQGGEGLESDYQWATIESITPTFKKKIL